jgi:hypothetical protein
MSVVTTQHVPVGRQGWRTVRHYAYVPRRYEDAWPKLVEAPQSLFGGDATAFGQTELHVRRAGMEWSRSVTMRFGGVVCDEDQARMALHWEDSQHPALFPVLNATISLVPLTTSRRHVTQLGLVGRYRPPFGALGGVADRMAGEDVAAESVATFLEDVARRLESMVNAEPFGPQPGQSPSGVGADGADATHILIPVDGLGGRRGGAVVLNRRLAAIPGVVYAEVDPIVGLAAVRYDPDLCSLSRIVAELEVDGAA